MDTTLPAFAAIKPAAPAAKTRANANAPSLTLPLRFMATGLAALGCGVVWLAARPDILASYHYSPEAVAATHLFVLGWIATIVMGAMYQLVPVALETRLYSERLARWQFVFHVAGFVGMVWMFRVWNMAQVGHFGCLMLTGFGLFAYNIVRTLIRAPKWTATAWATVAALFWLCFAGIAGLSIAAGKCVYNVLDKYPAASAVGALLRGLRNLGAFMGHFDPLGAMHAHAHLGVVGVFLMLIVGVSYKLVPMFTLSEVQNPRRALWSILLLNAGLAATFVAVLLQSSWRAVGALVIVAALALYGIELGAILRARKRRALDWGLRYFLTGIGLLAPVSIIGLALARGKSHGQLENVYGFLGLIGIVSFAIIGMLYKIAPFLVWYGVYSRHIGRARVPDLAAMYSRALQAAGYWTFLAGLITTCIGILFQSETGARAGCILLAASLGTLAVNMSLIASHYIRPRLNPIATAP